MVGVYEFDAIGTHWWIELLDGSHFDEALVHRIKKTVQQFDLRYSRFRDESLVSELYRTGSLSHPPAEMIRMLEFAREMHEVSEGAFDISVGNTLHRMGYGKRSVARSVGTLSFWDHLTLTPMQILLFPPIAKGTVPLAEGEKGNDARGIMLDFGGFGKGWLIDQLVRDLKLVGKQEFIVNGGGDLYVHAKKPMRIALEDPMNATSSLGHVDIIHGALAGSNTIKRVWQDGSDTKHHIIDPLTDDSSKTGVIASFVMADSALIADATATILILRPALEEKLKHAYNLQAVLIRKEAP